MNNIWQGIETFVFDKVLSIFKGKKTVVGLIGLAVCYIASAQGVAIPDFIIKALEGLVGVGFYDKVRTAGNNTVALKKQLEDIYNQVKQ